MDLEKIKNRIIELCEKINQWNKEYYIDNNPSVSDLVFDKALLELETLEEKYPQFKFDFSPTNFVGGFAENKFKKVTHNKPMLSLAKAYNYDEILKYVNNLKKNIPIEEINFSIEPKIDGLSISLTYKNGKLVQAATRGDALVGEDVTENIYQIKSLPKMIDYKKDLEVRGEAFILKETFKKINAEEIKKGNKPFANARNAASGTLRQLDPKIVKSRDLNIFIFELISPDEHGIKTQREAIEFLDKLKIPVNPYNKVVELEELEDVIEQFAGYKDKLAYDADGLVIKLNKLTLWEKMGKTSKFPKHSIAFKYDVEVAISKIKNITTTVGRTGKITYLASLEPVELNQTIVRAATLHNYDYIKDMKIDIGDDVKIIKAGEIIPKVIGIAQKNKNSYFGKTLKCPSCKSELVEIDGMVDQFCLNKECPEMNVNSIHHFCSRNGLNIVGFGNSTVKDLYPKFIKNIRDIFELHKYKEEIKKIDRYGEQKVSNLLKNIEKAKKSEFYKVIFSLGIKNIGLRAAKLISNEYDCFVDILEDPELKKIQGVKNIGPKIIESLKEYIEDEENRKALIYFDSVFKYTSNKNAIKSEKFKDQTFVITGKLSEPRNHFVSIIEENSGSVSESVSKKTSYVLVGLDAGSKLEKAQKLGIKILNEKEFYKLLD